MSEAYMGCGECGATFAIGEEHECKKKQERNPTTESLQEQLNFLAKVLKDQDERITELETE